MSRSNPTETSSHPCQRWHEWGGSDGQITYYDKNLKETVTVGDKFTFILLDSLSCVKGWHDPSNSGITSNEVKDTRSQEMTVRAFKGGVLAEGLYADIRDRVASQGGKFTTNLYIAFRDGTDPNLKIGSLQLSGAALKEWMEFAKANKGDLYTKAIHINGSKEGKKGSIRYKTPVFSVKEITPETNEQATNLDIELQKFLKEYMGKAKYTEGKSQRQEPAESEKEEDPDRWEPEPDEDIPY